MSLPRFHVWYSYKSGLGAEIIRIAPLLRKLRESYRVCITSFHAFVYDPEFEARMLVEESPPLWSTPVDEPGVCFFCDVRENGPTSWPSLLADARQRGWPLINEDLGLRGGNIYGAAAAVAEQLVPGASNADRRCVLRRPAQRNEFLVLNIFGGAAVEKGFSNEMATRSLVLALGHTTPQIKWVVPALPHQRLASVIEDINAPNVSLRRFDYGDAALAELFYARAVVTVEGGGMHVAAEYGVPLLLASSPDWLAVTRTMLPPVGIDKTVIVDMAAHDQRRVADSIASWVTMLRPLS